MIDKATFKLLGWDWFFEKVTVAFLGMSSLTIEGSGRK